MAETSSSTTNTRRTVLITGASKNSLGDALAHEFLRRGLDVIATARSVDKIQHLEPLGIRLYELDLTSSASIAALAQSLSGTQLDILFNNAGAVTNSMLADLPISSARHMFDVNFFGAVDLTQQLLPLLIRSRGIIVNHTSQSAYAITSLSGIYAASKAALAMYTDVLRTELRPFDVKVMELVTGGALSNITGDMPKPLIPDGSLYAPIKPEIQASMEPEQVRKMVMEPEKYAKRVVGDVLRSRGPPIWTWRGTLASTMWVVWIMKCTWKGVFDGVLARLTGLHLLKGRIQAEAAKKIH